MLFPRASLAFAVFSTASTALGATPSTLRPPTPIAVGAVFAAADSLPNVPVLADSTSLLTADDLTRMMTFLAAYTKEPLAVRDTGSWHTKNRERLQIRFPASDGEFMGTNPEIVNLIAMAASYPSVAADFKQAGVTPMQGEGVRRALFLARATRSAVNAGLASPPAPTSVAGKNFAFLVAHQEECVAILALRIH